MEVIHNSFCAKMLQPSPSSWKKVVRTSPALGINGANKIPLPLQPLKRGVPPLAKGCFPPHPFRSVSPWKTRRGRNESTPLHYFSKGVGGLARRKFKFLAPNFKHVNRSDPSEKDLHANEIIISICSKFFNSWLTGRTLLS